MAEIQKNYGVRLEPVTPRVRDWTFSPTASKPGLSDLDEKQCLDALLEFKERVRSHGGRHGLILQECDRCGLPGRLVLLAISCSCGPSCLCKQTSAAHLSAEPKLLQTGSWAFCMCSLSV